MIRTTLLALLAGTTLTTTAIAQDTTPQAERPHPILRLDTNGDGQVSLEEAQAAPANPMAMADSNGDGTLTRDEVIAAATERATQRATDRAGQMFDRFDEDGDGQIAIDNLPQPRGNRGDRIERMFERADANDDGVLDAEEIADLPEHGKRGHDGKRGHGHDRDRG
ncbi:EF hand [Rhodobacteraceae bacterium THAF1]|uniref:EF-hand domain-containing protein n=1 Tax=Palleronia sp. THAF1 TaxID=2587842 RepID=UPI000F3FC6F7|nr:calcium-binding protein [Palleronia sp. THAF1]QFU09742.1 EF hand [Palleronia sp. THAF1]VDC17355.1 EF hand [Rhodobacteraceae bacterium THAF1]